MIIDVAAAGGYNMQRVPTRLKSHHYPPLAFAYHILTILVYECIGGELI